MFCRVFGADNAFDKSEKISIFIGISSLCFGLKIIIHDMKRLLTLALLLAVGTAGAQETPLWLRKSAISPDGTRVAFSYKGDIYVVSSDGGKASQITTNEAYDSDPMWTRDSRNIVFSSYRDGSKDIFMTGVDGGIPKKLTDIPGSETPLAVLPDGRVLFSASLQADASFGGFPGDPQIYITAQDAARPQLVTSLTLSALSVNADGTVLYEDYKGYEDPLRKHHTSSVTRDIWVYKGASMAGDFKIGSNGSFTQLTSFEGENRNPVFAADGDTYYYLSEENGKTINLFRSKLSTPGVSEQLTFEEKNPLRYISVADNGTVVYSCNGELYAMRNGAKPRKIDITVVRDEVERDMTKMKVAGGARSMAVSPNGKEVAVIVRGDVYVTSEEYGTTRRITNTSVQERDLCFSKDGRTLYYSSERNGHWGIYKTTLKDKKDKYFTYATRMEESLFSDAGETCFQPKVSPDGKMVAYFRNRTELVVKPADGGKTRSLLKDAIYSYRDGDHDFEWSPDSQYILSDYQADGGWNNSDIALVEVETGKVTNLTQSGYSDGAYRWAMGGKAMTWMSDKNGYRSHGSWGAEEDIYIMFFDGKAMTKFLMDKEDEAIEKMMKDEKAAKKEEKKDSAAKEKPKKVELDLEHRFDRVVRLTRSSMLLGDHYLNDEGTKLYYIAPLESGRGLCELDIKEDNVKVLQRGVSGAIVPAKDGKSIYVFSGMGIRKIALSGGPSKQITFSGEFEYRPREEREYIFEHVWKQVEEKFYDPNIHGVDWAYYRDNYRRFLPYINNNFDFQDLLSELLGELNGSHTGARYYYRGGEALAHLGVLYDLEYKGDGLKIKEVLPDGPINIADSGIKAGAVIESIDGVSIAAGDNWYKLLAGKAGKKVILSIKNGGKTRDLIVEPSYSDAQLLYKRWVRQREEIVERLSGGRIGYVHVKGMNSESFREVYSKALGKYRTCDALIVDTRHNGGGWLHDDLATFLSGKAYIEFRPRGQYIGTEPYSKWTKPSCVLMGEDNYSDACGFPYTYKTLGIGKLIGAPVPGTMTAVWWEYQIDPTIVFGIPEVGSYGLKEKTYIENYQIEPDVLVYNSPADELSGRDVQLETAVREMLAEVGK